MRRAAAWALGVIPFLTAPAVEVYSRRNHGDVSGGIGLTVAMLTMTTLGAVIVARLPGQRMGPVLLVGGYAGVFAGAAAALSPSTTYVWPTPPEAPLLEIWLVNSIAGMAWITFLVTMVFLIPTLFPDGLPAATWLRWPVGGGTAAFAVAALAEGPLRSEFSTELLVGDSAATAEAVSVVIENPTGVEWLSNAVFSIAGTIVVLGALSLSIVSVVVRYRGGDVRVRRQLGVVVWSVVLVLLLLGIEIFIEEVLGWTEMEDWAAGLTFSLIPLSVGYAVLRGGVYDLGLIVRRTLSWAIVALTLGAVFAGIVLAVALFVPGRSDDPAVVAAATLAAFLAFNPLRRRTQAWVDRRFDRGGYDSESVVGALGSAVRDEVDTGAIAAAWQASVEGSLHPTDVRVWLTNR